MAPPAKRRKRNVVSDDEEETRSTANTLANFLVPSPDRRTAITTQRTTAPLSPTASKASKAATAISQLPSKLASQPRHFRANGPTRSGSKSASSSPEKQRSRPSGKSKLEEKGRTADLKTLFSKQAERAPPASSAVLDDIISDPISDDDEVGSHRAVTASHIGTNARKRFRDAPSNGTTSLAASQRFLKPPRPHRDLTQDDERRPWSERFGPVNLEELVVHKKKVADVRQWLEEVMAGRMRQRLLILKGAAGTGKTTTVRLLAKDMHCELLEWRNPTSSGGLGFQSASAQFEEFLNRGGKFGQLDIELDDMASAPRSVDSGNSRKIILIEEFPNTFTRSSTALQSFRSTIMSYLASNTPSLAAFGKQQSPDPITPVVVVISETLLTTTSASADSFTAHRLLGPEIIRHPGAGLIEFNAVAPTLLANALELIVQKEARKSGRKRTPGPMVLKRLGEIGDIRSAISSLEFLCLKGDAETDWGAKITFTKPKRGSKNTVALTKSEADSLELISQREASLGIFHAVGKVVYNKREETPVSNQTEEGRAEVLPRFMAHHSRPRRSEVAVESLIDEIGTDTHTFISALHENYALSCAPTGPDDLSSSVDYINDCIDYLSESDLLSPAYDIFFGGRGSGPGGFSGKDSASHLLRQDEITFQVATRGLLFSLPNPVKRIGTTSSRGGGDAFKMFYPTSLKLWREKEELEGVVDMWSTRLMKGDDSGTQNLTDGASAFRKPKSTSSGDWISKQTSQRPHGQSQEPIQGQEQPAPLLSLGSSARRELLLERLPYMAQIARRRRTSLGPSHSSNIKLKELERVVSFSGINGTADEDALDGDEATAAGGEEWATDKPTEEASPRKKSQGLRQKSGGSAAELSVQQLVISDDDIEDD
ncbi:Rad17 cell cycle checkpoint protein-domain-containing protein [Xylariales sp. PMI_506]|nr:Rad17 cell cycle checkpoint protein-domain-containing protein [Xylariales sp. PMI_506]